MAHKHKRTATVTHPSVLAALEGLYRFPDEEKARQQLAILEEFFLISRSKPVRAGELRLWVKGYALTPQERKEGYRGHFAWVRAVKEQNHWTLRGEKDPEPLAGHPERIRPKRPHPDWGHPLLRDIKQENPFATLEEASARLEALQEAFPQAAVTGIGKLYLMVYEGGGEAAAPAPVKKYILKPVPVTPPGEGEEASPDGPWKIHYIVNPKRIRTPARRAEPAPDDAPKGAFAKMLDKRKK